MAGGWAAAPSLRSALGCRGHAASTILRAAALQCCSGHWTLQGGSTEEVVGGNGSGTVTEA